MMKVFLSVVGNDSEKTIDIPSGKTVLGRGPFLGCSDKKVSRNHAVLEVQPNGEIFLTPTHVNPCFYRTACESSLRIIKKDIPQKLLPGDIFSLLPNSFQYEVHQKTPDGKILPLPNDPPNKGKSNALNPSEGEESLGSNKSEDNNLKKLTENGEQTESTNMQKKSLSMKLEGKRNDSSKNSSSEVKNSEPRKPSPPKSADSNSSSPSHRKVSSETGVEVSNPFFDTCAAKSPKASQLNCPKQRTLPDWLLRSAALVLRETKNSNNGPSLNNNASESKSSNAKSLKTSSPAAPSNRVNNSTGRSYTGRQNRQTIQKISLDDFVVSDDEEVQWKSPDESDDSSQKSKSRRGARWQGRGSRRDSDSGSDWEMENRKSKKNWRSNDASSGSDWETSRSTPQKKRRGRPQRKSYNSDSGSDWELDGDKRRSSRRKAAPITRRPRRGTKRKASEDEVDDFDDEDNDIKKESEDDKKKKVRQKKPKVDDNDDDDNDDDDDDDEEEEEEKEDQEEEKSTKSSPARSEGGRKREPCLYAKKCYRKNASHFDVYSHPGDSDYTSPKEDDEEDEREEGKKDSPQKECPYGIDCFRKNEKHKKEYKHTKKVRPTREASKKTSTGKSKKCKYNEDDEDDDISVDESDEYNPEKEEVAN